MSEVRERISNVIAWAGFAGGAVSAPFVILYAVSIFQAMVLGVKGPEGLLVVDVLKTPAIVNGVLGLSAIAVALWLVLGITNYIMVGSFRLVPWKPLPKK